MTNDSEMDEEIQTYEDYMRLRNGLQECSLDTSTKSKILYLNIFEYHLYVQSSKVLIIQPKNF